MILSSSGVETEGQIVTALSHPALPSIALLISLYHLPLFIPTPVFILPSCRPSAFINPFPPYSSSASLHSSHLCSVISALSCLSSFQFYSLSLQYWLRRKHTQSPECTQRHTAELPFHCAPGEHITNKPTTASHQSEFQAHTAKYTETYKYIQAALHK